MSELSAWEQYKQKKQEVIEPQHKWVDPKIYSERLMICIDCPFFLKDSKTCTECGCFMIIKTKIPTATCPVGKW